MILERNHLRYKQDIPKPLSNQMSRLGIKYGTPCKTCVKLYFSRIWFSRTEHTIKSYQKFGIRFCVTVYLPFNTSIYLSLNHIYIMSIYICGFIVCLPVCLSMYICNCLSLSLPIPHLFIYQLTIYLFMWWLLLRATAWFCSSPDSILSKMAAPINRYVRVATEKKYVRVANVHSKKYIRVATKKNVRVATVYNKQIFRVATEKKCQGCHCVQKKI